MSILNTVIVVAAIWLPVISSDNNCSASLGAFAGGYLPDSSFTASSSSGEGYSAKYGRLSEEHTAWVPFDFQPHGLFRNEYLQVDLGEDKKITHVSTQGLTNGAFFTSTYALAFGSNPEIFDQYFHENSPQHFKGNINTDTVVTRQLQCPVVARYIRFFPLTFVDGIALKVDVLGCDIETLSVKNVQGFRNGSVDVASVDLFWDQRTSNVELFYMSYYPIGLAHLPYPTFVVKVVDSVLPISYYKKITALQSCTEYTFILRAKDKSGCGITEVHTITAQTSSLTGPIPPQNVTVDASVPESLTLNWEKTAAGYKCSDHIKHFIIFYRTQLALTFKQIYVDGNILSYTITGLTSAQTYYFQIAAYDSMNKSSDLVTLTADVMPKSPAGDPAVVLLISDQPNVIYIEWKNPEMDITGYSIYYRLKPTSTSLNSTTWMHVGLPFSNQETLLRIWSSETKPLLSWNVYEVYVLVYNMNYKQSSPVQDVLVIGKEPGKAPENVSGTVFEDSIELRWSPIPNKYLSTNCDGYQTFFFDDKIKYTITHNVTTKVTSRVISNLRPDTDYVFAVAAKCNDRVGPYSDTVKLRTRRALVPSPIIHIIQSSKPNTIYLNWTTINVENPTYTVFYKEDQLLDSWTKKLVGTATDVLLENLKPWQQYDVKIEVVDSNGSKNESSLLPVVVLGNAPGRSPTSFRIVSAGYLNVSIQWDIIDPKFIHGALEGYTIRYQLADNTNSFNVTNTTSLNATIRGLEHNRKYNLQVAGMTLFGIGPYTNILTATTKKIITPLAPRLVRLRNKAPLLVDIKWLPAVNTTRLIDTVHVFTHDEDNDATKETTKIKEVGKYFTHEDLIADVKPFTYYRIALKVCFYGICSNYSNSLRIKTSEYKPSAVRDLVVVKTENDVTIYWKPPDYIPGVIRKYEINAYKKEIGLKVHEYPKIVSNTTLSYVLEFLPPFVAIRVEVCAYTTMPGPVAQESFISPEGLPGAPIIASVVSYRFAMQVEWSEPEFPNGHILEYKVFYNGLKSYYPSYEDPKHVIVPANITKVRIDELVPGTLYEVQVYAKTSKGFGEPSPKKQLVTESKEPLEPSVPIVYQSEITSSTIMVHLKPAVPMNGEIAFYEIIMEEIIPVNDTPAKRRKRSDNNPRLPDQLNDYDRANELNQRIYIAAKINAINMKQSAKFELGNGKIYNGYRNAPLKPETVYRLYIRGVTDTKQHFLYGPTASILLPKTEKKKADEKPFPIPIPVLIGVGAFVIFIVICVVVVVLYIRSRRRRKKDKMNPIELGLIRVRSVSDEAPERPASLSGEHPIHPDHPPVPLSAFAKHVTKLHKNDNIGFKAEYNELEIGKEYSWDIAHLPENKPKNRYANIVAYDHSRVILSKIDGLPCSDYINASRLDGFNTPNAYFCTQAPLPNTFVDFWRMIWECRSTTIVMLTNLQEKNKLKCHRYWPDDISEYGDVIVSLVRKEHFADYSIRTFKLEKVPKQKNYKHEIQEVKQFHFTSWPDHGVPQYPTALLSFRRKVRHHLQPDAGPTIVHCSAGVGRTGAYIVIDTQLDRIEKQMDVDVYNTIAAMRTKRIAMVQTEDQYIFVHDAILEAALSGNTQILISDLRAAIRKLDQIGSDSKVSGFEKQWKALNHASPNPPKSECLFATQGENSFKNRFSTVLPVDESRVLLLPIEEKESSTYINAVYVDSFKRKNAFILTQSPLPRTIGDFWRMLCEHGVSTVVMLNAVDEGDDYAKFWPDSGSRTYDMINVEYTHTNKKDDLAHNIRLKPMYRTVPSELAIRNFLVTDTRNPNKSFKIKLFQYVGWTETRVPNTYKAIINLITQIERWQQQSGNGPITIMCSDGIGRSGTLGAIMYVLERIKSDEVFDAFQAVKKMRIQRTHVVKYMDQYKYIHFAVHEYLNAFDDTKL